MALSLRNLFKLVAFLAPPAFLFACSSNGGTGTGTGGHGGSTSSSTTSSTSTTSTTSSSGGDAGTNLCKNAADEMIASTKDVAGISATCAKQNLGNDPAITMCIKMGTGLSDGCVTCFQGEVDCAINKCLTPCLADSMGAACTACRAMNCDPAFVMCSGLPASAPSDGGDGG